MQIIAGVGLHYTQVSLRFSTHSVRQSTRWSNSPIMNDANNTEGKSDRKGGGCAVPIAVAATRRRQVIFLLLTCGSTQSPGNWTAAKEAESLRERLPTTNIIELLLRESSIALLCLLF